MHLIMRLAGVEVLEVLVVLQLLQHKQEPPVTVVLDGKIHILLHQLLHIMLAEEVVEHIKEALVVAVVMAEEVRRERLEEITADYQALQIQAAVVAEHLIYRQTLMEVMAVLV